MTYRDYAWLVNPFCVDDLFGGEVYGHPCQYGLKDIPDCTPSEIDCKKCWSQEIHGTVIAEAITDGYHGFEYKKGERFEVVVANPEEDDLIIRRLTGWKLAYFASGVRDDFKFYIEEDNSMKYKVGDKVRVKTWDRLVEEFGVNERGNIPVGAGMTHTDMKRLCGELVTISKVLGGGYYLKEDHDKYIWDDEMFSDLAFTKKDMKDGMLVEFDDGEKMLWFGGVARGVNQICFVEDDLSSTPVGCTIVRVGYPDFESRVYGSIDNFLKCGSFKEVIWEREKPEKEISAEEAFRILEKEYGCRVKIKKE